MLIREAVAQDMPFLERMVLAGYNWGEERFTLDWVRTDDMAQRYLAGFPGEGDLGFIALIDEAPVGAVWGRALPPDRAGYGFVDAAIPELSLAVTAEARGQGVATALLSAIIDDARGRGLPGLSLSVEDGNAARRLYERTGFTVVGRNGDSDTMVLSFNP